MNNYKYIINPKTRKKVMSNGKIGQEIIRNYINHFQQGGSNKYIVDSELPLGAIEMNSDQWTVGQIARPCNKIVALSLEPDDMDRYITSQILDYNQGKCFDENWEDTDNSINWKVYDKVSPKEYNFEITVDDNPIGKVQIYDNKLWLSYNDSEHDQIKKWLTENSDDFINTYDNFKSSLFGKIFQKSYPKVFDCKH